MGLRRRFEPDPRVLRLIETYGASTVGREYALDGDAMRRYASGISQRTTKWWIEVNCEAVARDLRAGGGARGGHPLEVA